jgi:predicted ribosome quality control (RQC) complex YloA/Tae2 family protein
MERGLSSFDIYVIVAELQDLRGCFVEKIYQLSRDEILLRVQQTSTNRKEQLYIRNKELLCLTQKQFDAPEKPSVFAMTLRKYLLNGKISEITQYEFDRIIKITIGRKEGDYTLVCELFSNGNIILLNPEGRIIRPLVKQEWKTRVVKSGELYIPPPPQVNPFTMTMETFQGILQQGNKDLVRTLATGVNLSGLYAEELCVRAHVDKHLKSAEMTKDIIQRLYQELIGFLEAFRNHSFTPMLVKKNGVVVDIIPVPFQSYKGMDVEPIASFSRRLDAIITARAAEKPHETKGEKKIEQLRRQLRSQQQQYEEFQKNITMKKLEGDLLYEHYQFLDPLLQKIWMLLKQKEKNELMRHILSNPIVRKFDPTEGELLVVLRDKDGNERDVALDFRKTVSENAQQKYEEGKKFQEKARGAQQAMQQARLQLETLKETDVVEKKKEVRREKTWWFEKYRWFIATEGNLVIAGRDATSNDLVVKKHLSKGDRYAHADIHGAPSCVIKSSGAHDEPLPISEKTLIEACHFAASYSRAWNQFGEAQAYWVLPEQVSKTAESGEYVPKGAFIIRGKRNYVRCTLEVAVGLVQLGEHVKLMGGPLQAVEARAKEFMVLRPGIIKKSTIAKKLSNEFRISTDEAEKVLPPGNLTIVRSVGFSKTIGDTS